MAARSKFAIYISLAAVAMLCVNLTVWINGWNLALYPIVPIAVPWCVAWLVGSSVHQSNLFTRLLAFPPLVFLGLISYSLYLWQELFVAHPGHFPFTAYGLPVIVPGMLIAATLSYYFIERPFARLGKRVSSTRLRRFYPGVTGLLCRKVWDSKAAVE